MAQSGVSRSIVIKPSWRRYMIRFGAAMVAYLAVLVPIGYCARHGLLPGKPWLYLIALAPTLPVAALVFVVLRQIEEDEDEYQRLLNTRAYVAATGLTLTICTGWGLLQNLAGLPTISLMHVFTIFCICQAVTTLWIRLRSRR